MNNMLLFWIGWFCIILAIFIAAGPVLALALFGLGLVVSSVAKWVAETD
jgi:1,4-dihydroxy-2-naphthoate octaprenyltransferase